MALEVLLTIGTRITLRNGASGVIASAHTYTLGDVYSVLVDELPFRMLLRRDEFTIVGDPLAWWSE